MQFKIANGLHLPNMQIFGYLVSEVFFRLFLEIHFFKELFDPIFDLMTFFSFFLRLT